jgi:hypothetical protein
MSVLADHVNGELELICKDWDWHSITPSCDITFGRTRLSGITHIIGDLFDRSFGHAPPSFPTHYLCLIRQNGLLKVAGYGHSTDTARYSLGGGMCAEPRTLRRLTPDARRAIDAKGGVAQFMIERYFELLADKDAFFSYVGHPVALQIDLRSGFLKTQHQHLLVHWPRGAPVDADTLIDEVHAIGPF